MSAHVKSRFIRHGACSKCGSSDARAHYSDGSEFCFSCQDVSYPTDAPWAIKPVPEVPWELKEPHDASYNYAKVALDWCAQYEITGKELQRHNIKWSPSREQLLQIYSNYFDAKQIGCIQARNFKKDASTRYYNAGDVNKVVPIYYSASRFDYLVLVEDAMSAIKVSRQFDAMPLLGSTLTYEKIMILKHSGRSKLFIWLDHDKYNNALTLSERFQNIGVPTEAICTDLDPKMYDNFQINYQITRFTDAVSTRP